VTKRWLSLGIILSACSGGQDNHGAPSAPDSSTAVDGGGSDLDSGVPGSGDGGPASPPDANVDDIDCGDSVYEGNVDAMNASDWEVLDGVTHLKGHLIIQAPVRVPDLSVRCVDGSLDLYGVQGPLDLGGLRSIQRVGTDLALTSTSGIPNLEGLEGLRHVAGDVLIRENQGLQTLQGLKSLVRIDGEVRIWQNPDFVSLQGLESLTYVGGKMWIANQPLTDMTGLPSLARVGGFDLVALIGFRDFQGLKALRRIDGTLRMEVLTSAESLKGLDGVKVVTDDFVIDEAPSLTSLAGFAVERIESTLALRYTAVSSIDELFSLQHLGENGFVRGNAQLPDCDVKAFEAHLREHGFQGMLTSAENMGTCSP
jgi:hypothetical protein